MRVAGALAVLAAAVGGAAAAPDAEPARVARIDGFRGVVVAPPGAVPAGGMLLLFGAFDVSRGWVVTPDGRLVVPADVPHPEIQVIR